MTLLSEASFLVTPNGYKEASKLYAAIPTNGNGDMTVTRATTATRVDENDLVSSVASNVPRIDYTGGGCPSILLEPQRTNIVLRSQEFDTTWTLDGTGVGQSITPNYATAPDGTNTAYRLQLNRTGGTYSRIQQFVTGLTTSYSFSVYMKSNTGFSQNVGLRIKSIGANNVVTTFWQRFTFTGTTNDPSAQIILYNLIAGTDVTADILIWGAQLETGTYPTSYIPTTTATVTRNADVLSRDNIYTNNLIVGGGGTWFVHLINNTAFTNDANGNLFLDTASGGITNGINIRSIGTVARLYINFYTSGVSTFQYLTTADTVKLAIKWNGATADVFKNGAKVVSATPFATTAMEHLGGNGSDQPKYIKQMALFAKPLTNAQCIALTTL
jgi:hypothetical protein